MTSHLVSLQISDEMKERLERLSESTMRSPTSIVETALLDYISRQEIEIEALEEPLEWVDNEGFVSHEAVAGWLKSWGTADEMAAPVAGMRKPRR